MIKFIGDRGSGKTTKLIETAHDKGYVLVEPTYQMAVHAHMRAREIGKEIRVIPAAQFFYDRLGRDEAKYLVDELDMFLKNIGIDGYSNGPRE